jgi:hypothetical protein
MLTIIIEVMFTIVLNKIGFLSNHKVVESNTILKIILSTLVYLWEYLLFLIPFIKKTSREIVRLFSSNINRLNIAYLLCITCFILGMLNIENFDYNGSIKLITILFVLFFLLGMLVINSITNQEYLKKSNERLVEYNDNYTKFLDEYKIYKHNINNKLVGMKAFGNKKINALIDDLLEEENTFTIKNNSLYNLPNGIKGIVAEKLYDLNINVIVTNKIKTDPFINLSPKSFNSVSECIGIALDNAIEASKETEEPVIIMDIYEDNNEIYVRIGNNFCNDIDINKLGQKYYSTKNRGSGLGLFSIKHNKIVKEKISIINNIFYIELKIKKHE